MIFPRAARCVYRLLTTYRHLARPFHEPNCWRKHSDTNHMRQGKFLNRFVLHYEPLSYEPISANHTQARRKRSLEQGHERVLLTFHAHSRRFRLSLINDRSAFSDELIIITSAGPVKASLDHLYSGYLIGVPKSRVVGSILDGVFHGRIETSSEEFYAEPASRYLKGDHGFHSIIYAGSDVVLQSGCGLHGATEASMNDLRRQYGRRNGTTLLRSKRSILEPVPSQNSPVLGRMPGVGVDFHARSPWMTGSPGNEERQQKVKRVCNLEINIDHTLYNAVLLDSHLDPGKTQESLIAMLTSHVTAASDMFRNTDFLGIADISFEIQRVLINNSESCDADKRATNPFCASDLDSAHMLHELSKINHDDFCLSYLWTYRDFVGGTLGLAYKAEPNGFPGTAGGICDKFQSGSSLHSSSSFLGRLSLNTGIVTFLNQNSRVPERITHITFTHELGHNFGSPVLLHHTVFN
ncbi:putative ADAM-10 [Ixodes scapularis]